MKNKIIYVDFSSKKKKNQQIKKHNNLYSKFKNYIYSLLKKLKSTLLPTSKNSNCKEKNDIYSKKFF